MKRRRFSPAIKAEIIQRQKGCCPYCALPLAGKAYEFDHVIPLALGGDDHPDNLEALHKVCHSLFKTRPDRAQIAKADRQAQRTGQQARRAAGKTAKIPSRPFPEGQRKMQSRPFPKPWKPEQSR